MDDSRAHRLVDGRYLPPGAGPDPADGIEQHNTAPPPAVRGAELAAPPARPTPPRGRAGSSRRQLTAGDAAADQAQQQPPHLVVAKQAHPESLHPSPSSPSAQERTGGMDIGSVKITQLGLEVDSALRQRARAEARNRQARGARAAALQRNGRNGRSKRPATAAAHPARYALTRQAAGETVLKLMLRDAADISRQFLAEVSHLSASKAARVATDRLLVLARSAVPDLELLILEHSDAHIAHTMGLGPKVVNSSAPGEQQEARRTPRKIARVSVQMQPGSVTKTTVFEKDRSPRKCGNGHEPTVEMLLGEVFAKIRAVLRERETIARRQCSRQRLHAKAGTRKSKGQAADAFHDKTRPAGDEQTMSCRSLAISGLQGAGNNSGNAAELRRDDSVEKMVLPSSLKPQLPWSGTLSSFDRRLVTHPGSPRPQSCEKSSRIEKPSRNVEAEWSRKLQPWTFDGPTSPPPNGARKQETASKLRGRAPATLTSKMPSTVRSTAATNPSRKFPGAHCIRQQSPRIFDPDASNTTLYGAVLNDTSRAVTSADTALYAVLHRHGLLDLLPDLQSASLDTVERIRRATPAALRSLGLAPHELGRLKAAVELPLTPRAKLQRSLGTATDWFCGDADGSSTLVNMASTASFASYYADPAPPPLETAIPEPEEPSKSVESPRQKFVATTAQHARAIRTSKGHAKSLSPRQFVVRWRPVAMNSAANVEPEVQVLKCGLV